MKIAALSLFVIGVANAGKTGSVANAPYGSVATPILASGQAAAQVGHVGASVNAGWNANQKRSTQW